MHIDICTYASLAPLPYGPAGALAGHYLAACRHSAPGPEADALAAQARVALRAAVDRLLRAIQHGERICVWGDFDVDGQTSTTLLVACLRRLGAQVDFHIPVRASESHGVNLQVLSQILDGGVRLVLTCDTGISAHAGGPGRRQRGVDLIISDHHDLPPDLPQALAVINPKLLPGGHPLGTLPGVGVAYKLAEALYDQSGIAPEAEDLLDLVALGVVVDVALQVGDTRYLLQRGLQVLRRNQRLGLRAMLELAGVNPARLREKAPELRVRVVNVVDLTALFGPGQHPHAMSAGQFAEMFTEDCDVVFAFHGYAGGVHTVLHGRPQTHRFHVRGFREEGTTTTPFDMVVMNDLDRFHLVGDVIDRVPSLGARAAYLKQSLRDKLIDHKQYVRKYGQDMPEIRNWQWRLSAVRPT